VFSEFERKKPIFRIWFTTPAALGGVGATTNLAPSFTLGCGTWGGSSVSENVGPKHLLNIKRAAWHSGIPELPAGFIKPQEKASEYVPTSTNSSNINEKLIAEIVAQVMKSMNK